MLGSVEKITKFVLDLFFPVFCCGCGREGRYICTRCSGFVGEASLICPVCEESTFTGETHETCKGRYTLDGLIGVWEYEGVIKQLLLRIKYAGVAKAAQETMELAFLAMAKDTARFSSFLSFLLERDITLTYVPMWKARERKRGYNQALLIAQELGKICKCSLPLTNPGAFLYENHRFSKMPVKANTFAFTPKTFLQKIKDTKSQTDLDKKERLENVKDSFALLKAGFNRPVPKYVVLVDDVWTTGATMRECGKVLKRAGVEKVWGFTLARTV